MNTKLSKQALLIFLIASLLINTFQFSKLQSYKKPAYAADNEFINNIQLICFGIELIEAKEKNELSAMAVLASGTSSAFSIYRYTSYYKKNPDLYETLYTLNNNVTNRTNIREVIEQNDLALLYSPLKKIMMDPLNKDATEELNYSVRKCTVLGILHQ